MSASIFTAKGHISSRALLLALSRADGVALALMRTAIAVVSAWIGSGIFAAYEADGATPFVANSPLRSFFDEQPGRYKAYLTREGPVMPARRDWQRANRT